MALRMIKSKPKLCLLVCLYLALCALLNVACASTNNEFDVCEKALKKSGVTDIERDDSNKSDSNKRYGFGEYRVAVGNAGNYGFVCLLAPSQKNLVAGDLLFGLDTVGIIAQSKRIDLQNRSYLLTLQRFRGGSNSLREYYVLYRFDAARIRTALKIPYHKELMIGSYKLSEKNNLTPQGNVLLVSQNLSIDNTVNQQKTLTLYRSARKFELLYLAEFSAFVEGIATCTDDLVVKGKTWQKKGRRLGYVLTPGLADAAGLAIELVRDDGEKTIINDLTNLIFLNLGKKDMNKPSL